MIHHAVRWGTYLLAGSVAFFLTLTRPPPAYADRMHTPDDAEITVPAGTGTFIGKSEDIDFRRIQPIVLQPEFSIFSTTERTWLNHLELYVIGSLEQTDLTYKGDSSGEKDEIVRAELSSDFHWTLMGGLRLGLIGTDRLILNGFGHYGGTVTPVSTTPNVLTVRALGIELDAMEHINQSDVDFTLNWRMLHTGVTTGFPLPLTSFGAEARIVPYLTVGYLWFNSRVDIELSESVTNKLKVFGVEDKIPDQKSKTVNNVTGSVGMRFDFNKYHAIETTGSFFTDKNTTVYWLNASYSLRFGYPW